MTATLEPNSGPTEISSETAFRTRKWSAAEVVARPPQSEHAARSHRRQVNHRHFSLAPSEILCPRGCARGSRAKSPLPSHREPRPSELLQECRSRSLEPTRAATLSSTQHLSHDCQHREREAVNHAGRTAEQRGPSGGANKRVISRTESRLQVTDRKSVV